jgi:carbonic anhydrase/acetyltransferase-like protein (isoleucine patch superfamily)
MRKVIIRESRIVPPFNEPARDLRILNKPLWLHQRDILAPYTDEEWEVESLDQVPSEEKETLVYRDNLFFDEHLIAAFLQEAKRLGRACRIAFSLEDQAIVSHALPLQEGIRKEGDVYVADLWYFPHGVAEEPQPLVIDTLPREIGFYHIPEYMAPGEKGFFDDMPRAMIPEEGDLVFQVPLRPFLSIENWVHIFMASSPFGVLSIGAHMENDVETKPEAKLRVFFSALLEHKQLLSCSQLVKVGKGTQIDPTAIIQGPTIIGDNVIIGPGCVVTNSIIGNNVNVYQGSQVFLSVVSDGCYLPFRAALFMTTLMENSMVAQNATLHLCVVGRDTFIGSGVVFTDFNLLPKPLRTMHNGRLEPVRFPVLGGCVGHHCRIGANLTIYPGRIIESDTVLIPSSDRLITVKNVPFEASDHHGREGGERHQRLYPSDSQSIGKM